MNFSPFNKSSREERVIPAALIIMMLFIEFEFTDCITVFLNLKSEYYSENYRVSNGFCAGYHVRTVPLVSWQRSSLCLIEIVSSQGLFLCMSFYRKTNKLINKLRI